VKFQVEFQISRNLSTSYFEIAPGFSRVHIKIKQGSLPQVRHFSYLGLAQGLAGN